MNTVAPELIRPPRRRREGSIRWLCGRSLLLHLTLVIVAPVCLLAGWWQLQRALGGNTLSYVYVFEWPAFAGVALWAWWALLSAPTRAAEDIEKAPGPGRAERTGRPESAERTEQLLAARRAPLRWDRAGESGRLQAYNAYLTELNDRPPRRWRRRKW